MSPQQIEPEIQPSTYLQPNLSFDGETDSGTSGGSSGGGGIPDIIVEPIRNPSPSGPGGVGGY